MPSLTEITSPLEGIVAKLGLPSLSKVAISPSRRETSRQVPPSLYAFEAPFSNHQPQLSGFSLLQDLSPRAADPRHLPAISPATAP
jgi:hypothetical protein